MLKRVEVFGLEELVGADVAAGVEFSVEPLEEAPTKHHCEVRNLLEDAKPGLLMLEVSELIEHQQATPASTFSLTCLAVGLAGSTTVVAVGPGLCWPVELAHVTL
jgi:hypothetical protein